MKNKIIIMLSVLSCSLFQASDIFKAIELNDKKVIQKWLKNNPDVDLVNDQGQTVLIKAVQQENKNLVYQLLKCGAVVNKVDRFGRTALDYAVELGNKKIAKMLLGVSAMVTTESNAVRCHMLITSVNWFKRLSLICLGVIFLYSAYCMVVAAGCVAFFVTLLPVGSSYILGLTLAVATCAVAGVGIWGGCKLIRKSVGSENFYNVSLLQPTA